MEHNEYSKCTRYDVDPNEVLTSIANGTDVKLLQTNWNTIECDSGWNYNRIEVPYMSLGMEVTHC